MKPSPPRSLPKKASPKRKIEPVEPVLLSANPHGKPGEWDERQPLRATVLIYSPDEFKGILQGLARGALAGFFEKHYVLEPSFRGSMPKGHLLAAKEDLRFTARFLAYVARIGVEEVATPSETALGLFADGLALEVERIADAIEKRIASKRSTS